MIHKAYSYAVFNKNNYCFGKKNLNVQLSKTHYQTDPSEEEKKGARAVFYLFTLK